MTAISALRGKQCTVWEWHVNEMSQYSYIILFTPMGGVLPTLLYYLLTGHIHTADLATRGVGQLIGLGTIRG